MKLTYRVFTNDRAPKNGVPMYSCFSEVKAEDAGLARKTVPEKFGIAGGLAPIIAIEWPPSTQASKDWLDKHVGPNVPD